MNATLEAMGGRLFPELVRWISILCEPRWMGGSLVGLRSRHCCQGPDHLEDSPLGDIPKGWQVKRISEVVEEAF